MLRARGRTVIFSTHMMDNAERLCDAVCIIARGAKVLDGEVAAVREAHGGRGVAVMFSAAPAAAVSDIWRDRTLVARANDSHRSAEVELAPGADPQNLLRRLIDAGAQVERFELVRPSLHQIFLDTVGATDVEPGMSGQG